MRGMDKYDIIGAVLLVFVIGLFIAHFLLPAPPPVTP
jgi:hypothetical protein